MALPVFCRIIRLRTEIDTSLTSPSILLNICGIITTVTISWCFLIIKHSSLSSILLVFSQSFSVAKTEKLDFVSWSYALQKVKTLKNQFSHCQYSDRNWMANYGNLEPWVINQGGLEMYFHQMKWNASISDQAEQTLKTQEQIIVQL